MTLPTYLQFLRLAWRQYLLRFDLILWATAIIGIPCFVAIDLTTPTLPPDTSDTLVYLERYFSQPLTWLNIGVQLLTGVILLYVSIMIICALYATFQRQPIVWRDILKSARSYYLPVLAASILIGLSTALGFIGFIIPGIILSIFFSLTLPALVWYNLSPWKAMQYSWKLVRRQWWTVFTYIITTQFLLSLIATITVTILPNQIGFRTVGFLLVAIINSFAVVFHTLLFTALDDTTLRVE